MARSRLAPGSRRAPHRLLLELIWYGSVALLLVTIQPSSTQFGLIDARRPIETEATFPGRSRVRLDWRTTSWGWSSTCWWRCSVAWPPVFLSRSPVARQPMSAPGLPHRGERDGRGGGEVDVVVSRRSPGHRRPGRPRRTSSATGQGPAGRSHRTQRTAGRAAQAGGRPRPGRRPGSSGRPAGPRRRLAGRPGLGERRQRAGAAVTDLIQAAGPLI